MEGWGRWDCAMRAQQSLSRWSSLGTKGISLNMEEFTHTSLGFANVKFHDFFKNFIGV